MNGQVFTLDDEPCTQCTCQVSWIWDTWSCAARGSFLPLVPLQNSEPLSQRKPSFLLRFFNFITCWNTRGFAGPLPLWGFLKVAPLCLAS